MTTQEVFFLLYETLVSLHLYRCQLLIYELLIKRVLRWEVREKKINKDCENIALNCVFSTCPGLFEGLRLLSRNDVIVYGIGLVTPLWTLIHSVWGREGTSKRLTTTLLLWLFLNGCCLKTIDLHICVFLLRVCQRWVIFWVFLGDYSKSDLRKWKKRDFCLFVKISVTLPVCLCLGVNSKKINPNGFLL